MTPITPSMRLMWLAAANPNPLPDSWIEEKIKNKPTTIETENSRESFAVGGGSRRGLFFIQAWTVKPGGGNIYSISYPKPKQAELL